MKAVFAAYALGALGVMGLMAAPGPAVDGEIVESGTWMRRAQT
jgi:hypothetical protein